MDVIRCSFCEDNPVKSYCVLCRFNLCKSCIPKHISFSESTCHAIVKFSSKYSTILKPEVVSHASECDAHCVQCEVSVCSKCSLSSRHERHNIRFIGQELEMSGSRFLEKAFPKTSGFLYQDNKCLEDILVQTDNLRPSRSVSENSLAYHLLGYLKIDEFCKQIHSLQHKVLLVEANNLCDDNLEDGRVCMYRVSVKPTGKTLLKQKPNIPLDQFTRIHHVPRVFLVSSCSVCITDSKLFVYKEYKDVIENHNIRIYHVLDSCKEIQIYCAKYMIDTINEQIETLMHVTSMLDVESIVGKALTTILSKEKILKKFHEQNTKLSGEVEHAESGLVGFSEKEIQKFEENVIMKTLEKLGEDFAKEVVADIVNCVGHEPEKDVKRKAILSETTSQVFGSKVIGDFLANVLFDYLKSIQELFTNIGKLKAKPVQTGSVEWEQITGNKTCEILSMWNVAMMKTLPKNLQTQFHETMNELREMNERFTYASSGIYLAEQKEMIDEWMLREFQIENVEKCPSILQFIAGRKNGKIVMKVFLEGSNSSSESFCRENAVNKPIDAVFEFIDINLKSESQKKIAAIMQREEKGSHIKKETKKRIKEILEEKEDILFAKYSSLVSISMSPVKYNEDSVMHEACILLFCLDADLVPFGEEPLPKSLEEFECIILEDFIQFGKCENCQVIDHGCSVGIYGDMRSGSVGFFAKKHVLSSNIISDGFLTAAHVALKDDLLAKLNEKRLSDYSSQNEIYHIVHPSFGDSHSNNIIGHVEDSFFGNYNSIGIDAAFIKTNDLQHRRDLYESSHNFDIDSDEEYEVIKKGRTTGETRGLLKKYPNAIRKAFHAGVYLKLTNSFLVHDMYSQNFFLPGDSGAAVYVINKTDNSLRPLGLAFGKMTGAPITYACPVRTVADVFNLTILKPAEPMEIP